MPKKSIRLPFNFHLPQFTQISESHCGPAVIQMLLGNLGIEVSQEAVAEAGGAAALIDLHGMRVDQMAVAVYQLAPQAQFWYKENSALEELISLVRTHRYPVGVEWQGLFEDDDDEDEDEDDDESEDPDYGHYSVVTHVDKRRRQLIIADPYKDYASQDRIFTYKEFVERWWDTNEIIDPETGEPTLVEDTHMMFIITPQDAIFPMSLGMQPGIPLLDT